MRSRCPTGRIGNRVRIPGGPATVTGVAPAETPLGKTGKAVVRAIDSEARRPACLRDAPFLGI